MSGSWRLMAGLCGLLVFCGLLLSNAALLYLALPLLAIVLVPFVGSLPSARASAEWKADDRPAVDGTPFEVRCVVTNRGPSIPFALIEFLPPAGVTVQGRASLAVRFEGGGSWTLGVRVLSGRGSHVFRDVRLETGDVLGLRREVSTLPLGLSILVLPRIERIERLEIFPRRTGSFPGVIRSRAAGSGSEFFGTREYSPGDAVRRLNWRAAERWDRLVTNLFEEEKAADVGIILDARQATEVRIGEESLFERSAAMAATLADYFLRAGNRVGLLSYGRGLDWVFPGYGQEQRRRVLASLCAAAPMDHVVFREFRNLPIRLFPPRSQLVFVSPLQPQDVQTLRYLCALDFEVLIVSPDPISFELRHVKADAWQNAAARLLRARRAAVVARLRRSGARVLEWDTAVSAGTALSRLSRRGRG